VIRTTRRVVPHTVKHLAKPRLLGLLMAGAGTDSVEARGGGPVHAHSGVVVPLPAGPLLLPTRPKPNCVVGPRLRQIPCGDGLVHSCLQLALLLFCLGHGKALVLAACLSGIKRITVAYEDIALDFRGGASYASHCATPFLLG
jgi:hypothetical protein